MGEKPVDSHARHVRLIVTTDARGDAATVAQVVSMAVLDLAPLGALPLVGSGAGGAVL